MYLKRLELVGFKSFANRTTLEMEPGIVVVVGPNGSGKSNVADAVRWVLGEQSMRAVRGKRSEDVIFAGSATRQPLGMAEVSLTLDNADGRAPLAYQEVRVSRRVYRSGESEYLLNGSRVRLRDVVEVLTHAGIGSESYCVIGQGAVDELLLQRPEDRRQVFESAADIRRYQIKLTETRSRLESAQQNLTRCRDVMAELEPHLRRLRNQSDRAERARQLEAELWGLAARWFRRRLSEVSAEVEAAERRFRAAESAREELEARVARQEQSWRQVEQEAEADEARLQVLRPRVDALRAQRAQLEREIAVAEERVRQIERQTNRDAEEQAALQARLGELETDLASAAKTRSELDDLLRGERARVSAGLDDLRRLDQRRSSIEAHLADADRRRTRLQSERSDLQRRSSVLEVRLEALQREVSAAATAETEQRRALEDLAQRVQQLEQECASLETERRSAGEENDRLAAERRGLAQRQAELERAIVDEERKAARLEASLQQLAPTRPDVALKGVPDNLTALAAGMLGALGEHLYVEPVYERAIGAALSQLSAALVFESREHQERIGVELAHQPGRWLLLAADAGTASDLHIFKSSVRELVGDESPVSFADEVVESPEQLRGLVAALLGRTLVVEDQALVRLCRILQDAPGIGAPWQVVSLSGTVVRSAGEWVVGAGGQTDATLSRARDRRRIAEELSDAHERLVSLAGELDGARASTAGLEDRARELSARLARVQETLALRRALLDSSRRDHRGREQSLAQHLRRIEDARRELAQVGSQRETAATAISEREQEIAELERQRNEASAQLHELRARAEQQRGALSSAQTELAVREAHAGSIAELERRLMAETDRIRAQLGRVSRTQTGVSASLEEHRQASAERRERLKHLEQELLPLSAELEACEAERRERASARHGLDEAMIASRREARAADEEHEAASLALERARDELGRVRREAGEILLQDQPTEETEWPTQLRMVLDPPGGTSDVEDEPIPDMAAARRRINTLQRELRSIGTVNQGVLDEYQEMAERHEFLQGQSRDLHAAIAELEQAIGELESVMSERFADTFSRVNEFFKETFAILFGGGHAELVLTRPESLLETGVDVVARPPGKRLQGLVTLSGGERALTSVALLFALLRVNPAPFVLLDEVDAALDEANVQRFARLLKEYAREIQFLVITHNRATMEIANALFGVSMEAGGISRVLSVHLAEARQAAVSTGAAV